jgi:predicted CXXCH cytochrome family protein
MGECRVCHDPHATDNPALLPSDPVALCTGCHTDIAFKMETASTPHAALTSERECLNCHTPHAGNTAHLLKNDEMTLCFECHNKEIKLKDGGKLMNIKALIQDGTSLHGPVAEHSCVVCHEIHGGGHQRLLKQEYPAEIYPMSESAYSLCFSCHDRQMALLPNTVAVTRFRNGDRNLHQVHVDREKSRSCRICHDTHAASRERHIRDDIAFGPAGWRLPIQYQALPDGGQCGAGCHAPFRYSRTDPVTYPPHEADRIWDGADLVPGVRAPAPNPIRPRK